MTDRIRHLTVILDHDTRDDDLEPLVAAISQLRGVAAVTPHVVDGREYLARMTLRAEVERELLDAVQAVLRRPGA